MNSTSTNTKPVAKGQSPVLFSLMVAARNVEGQIETALDQLGLSMAKLGVLGHLAAASEPLTLSELAARIQCVRSNVTQLVDRLEVDGLVRRVDDPDDRRSIRAELTVKGRELQLLGDQKVAEVYDGITATLSADDQQALARVLGAIR